MQIEEHRWHSPHLGREMALKIYGQGGQPFVVFPSSRGRYFDYEGMGMIAAMANHIDSGRIKLFCIDSVDDASWYNFRVSPADRNAGHEAYDRYVVAEVIPFIRAHCHSPRARVMANGCSMGARRQSRLALVVPPDELFPGTDLRRLIVAGRVDPVEGL
nr:hypothetical protein [Desulfobacterales bacterium]